MRIATWARLPPAARDLVSGARGNSMGHQKIIRHLIYVLGTSRIFRILFYFLLFCLLINFRVFFFPILSHFKVKFCFSFVCFHTSFLLPHAMYFLPPLGRRKSPACRVTIAANGRSYATAIDLTLIFFCFCFFIPSPLIGGKQKITVFTIFTSILILDGPKIRIMKL